MTTLGTEFEDFMLRTWQTTEDKGFHEQPTTFVERLMLIVSEASEAMEEYRNGHPLNEIYFEIDKNGNNKPEGVAVELGDMLIRIAELCYHENIPIVLGTNLKLNYNDTREHMHGNKRF